MKNRLLQQVIASVALIVAAVATYVWNYPEVSGGILIACAVCALTGSFGVLWFAPKLQLASMPEISDPKDKFDIENEARKSLATILGASFFLFSGYAAWSNLESSLNKDRAAQLTQSLEMIESDKPSTRVAGANSLAALTREFNSKDDYQQAVRVMNDVVQQHATLLGKTALPDVGCGPRPTPTAEIQRLLKFLGNRRYPSIGSDDRLALEDVDLRGAYMGGTARAGGAMHLSQRRGSANGYAGEWAYATFYGSDLSAANFSEANLENAQFAPSVYTGQPAKLADVCVQTPANPAQMKVHTTFSHADLRSAVFSATEMHGAELLCADARNAKFPNANLTGADLMCTNLQGADLNGADLTDIDMSKTLCVTWQQLASAKHGPAKPPHFGNCPAEWSREKCDIGAANCMPSR